MNQLKRIIFAFIAILIATSCANNLSKTSNEVFRQIDGIYKLSDGSKWIEFKNGHFNYYYEAQKHMLSFDCHKLSFGSFKLTDENFIELNSSDSILHTGFLFENAVKKMNRGNRDSIYVKINRTKQDTNFDYILSYIYDEFRFSKDDSIRIKKEPDDIGIFEVKAKLLYFPHLYKDGRYKGLPDISIGVDYDDFNYFEIDLSSFDECRLAQEYYKGEFIRYTGDKIFWNGEVFLKTNP